MSQLNFMLDSDTLTGAILDMLQATYLDPKLVCSLYQRIEGADARRTAAEAGTSNENVPGDGTVVVY